MMASRQSTSSSSSTPFHGGVRYSSTPAPVLPLQGDARFSNDVASWLSSLGFKKDIDKNDLKRLCPKSHRAMWYHLMKHVRPAQEVDLIKKNVLISNLEKNQNKYKKPLKAIVNTPEDFENYKAWIDVRNEIGVKENEVRTITGDIRALQMKTRFEEHQIKVIKEQTSECNQKADLLQMKIKQERCKLENLRSQVDTGEVLIKKAFALEKDEPSTDKISSFVTELENLHYTRQMDKNEVVSFENGLLWDKVDELALTVPPNDIINYASSTLVTISEKLNEELIKFTTLKANVSEAGASDSFSLQKSLQDTFIEYLVMDEETEQLKANVDNLKHQVTDNIIKKFSLTSNARESIMLYVDRKCAMAYQEQKSKSYKKVISDNKYSDKVLCLDNLIKMLNSRVEQMNGSIENKVAVLSESINILLNKEGTRKIEEIREETMKMISEFSSSESGEDCTLLNLRGTLKNEVSLFLKVPLKKNQIGDKPPLPSVLQHFPLNRQKHLLPLQILVQRLQMAETEKLISNTSEAQLVKRMADQKSDKKLSLAMVKQIKENNEAELKKRMMWTMCVIEEAERHLMKARNWAELLDKENTLNKLLLRRDPSAVEEFVKYEEIIRKSVVELNNFITKK